MPKDLENKINAGTNGEGQDAGDAQGVQAGTGQQPKEPAGKQNEGGSVNTTAPSLEDVLKQLSEAGNDTLLNLAPVKELVQNARKQEKDKLYKTLEQREKEAKELQEQLQQAMEALKKYEEQNLTAEEKVQRELEKLRKEHDELVQALQREKEEAERKARKAELERYKAEKLREAGNEIIPELVGGDSEEEIDASIERAKAKYQEIAQQFEAKLKQTQTAQIKDAFHSTNPAGGNIKPLTAEEIRRMSPEEYAKHREQILAMIRRGELD